ncbi:MAG: Crp/Fnr family transcriptional regulator [Pseudomonadota bacterium]
MTVERGQGVFFQGDTHRGIWIVEEGRVRTFYAGPSGREITLAYWTPGHFVGGPEVFGRGRHIWSADALTKSALLFLPGDELRSLIRECPGLALALIDGLVAKGKCYSALIQMLGTRSISERLEQLLVILADTRGEVREDGIVIARSITFEQLATLVGATRQWVSQSMEKLEIRGIVSVFRKSIVIHDLEKLRGPESLSYLD